MVFVIAPQLRRGGLCGGQNQMCHLQTGLLLFFGVRELCLCGWLKITRLFNLSFSGARESLRLFELKKSAVEKIKNTEGSAMSVGSVAVQLKYVLYVGHLSKLAFHLMFKVVRLVVVGSSVRLACNVLQLQEVGDFGDENCLPPLNLIRSTKLHLTTEPPISCRCCYAQFFFSRQVIYVVLEHKISMIFQILLSVLRINS